MPLPKPKEGEPKSRFISRCISFVKGEDPNVPTDQAVAMCYTQWRRSQENMETEIIENVSLEEMDDNKVLEDLQVEFAVPVTIKEEVSTDGSKNYVITGTALEATVSRNKIKYTEEEIEKAEVDNVPLLKDHEAKVDNIIGRVDFIKEDGKLKFTAKNIEKTYWEKIKKGLIRNVSIGATVKRLVKKVEEGIAYWIAEGIGIVELSLVAVPGVRSATIDQAIVEKYGGKIMENKIDEAKLTYKQRQSLPDSAFAYVAGSGDKKVRVFPIHDAAHVRNALARFQQGKTDGIPPDKLKSVLRKIIAAAKKFGIEVSPDILKKAKENLKMEIEELKRRIDLLEEEGENEPKEDTEDKENEEPEKKEEPKQEEQPEKKEETSENVEVSKLKEEIEQMKEVILKMTKKLEKKSKGLVEKKEEKLSEAVASPIIQDKYGNLYQEWNYDYFKNNKWRE